MDGVTQAVAATNMQCGWLTKCFGCCLEIFMRATMLVETMPNLRIMNLYFVYN